jgi:MinD superfamily P-loop ATPase
MNTAGTSPKQLVVLSGKGGTGKTSLVAALAAITDAKVLADCDVDASDLHLLLDPAQRHRELFVSGREARISAQRCNACGLCMEHCRFGAIRYVQENGARPSYEVDPVACEGCGLCAHVCTAGAVDMLEAERGEWFVSDTHHGLLVHARLNIGGENSGKLVTLVREAALRLARETGASLVLVDGPPGIGCPAIATVTGADLVLAVTEPTVSAAHDLRRLADLVKGFDLPLAVCVNKSYDTAMVRAQVEGRSIIESAPSDLKGEIRDLWKTVEAMLYDTKE